MAKIHTEYGSIKLKKRGGGYLLYITSIFSGRIQNTFNFKCNTFKKWYIKG